MKKTIRNIVIAFVLFVLVISGLNSIYIVNEGEYAYVTQFGAIMTTDTEPGLKVKVPFIQEVNYLTKKVMDYDISSSEVLTADKKAMVVDSYALWRIDDVTTFMRTVGNISEMQRRIDASVYSVIKNLTGRLMQDEIIADEESQRSSLNEQVTQLVQEDMHNYGVIVPAVEIRRFDLPEDNLASVYTRMISEREQMAAAYRADGEYEGNIIRNETDKDVDILIGEARAEAERLLGEGEEGYMQTLSDIYNDPVMADFYLFMLELEALEEAMVGQKTIILGPESPITQILNRQTDSSLNIEVEVTPPAVDQDE